MKWVADTSWLYALIDDVDPHHREARGQAEQPDPVVVPQVILAETMDLIRYRHGKKAAERVLDAFEGLPHFVLGGDIEHSEASAIWRRHAPLSYSDAVAVAAARRGKMELRTFDRRQRKALQMERLQ